MRKNFKETVQGMSAGEIIMAMVNGLKKPYLNIAMYTFGQVDYDEEDEKAPPKCFGCAATNAICNIIDQPIPAEYLGNRESRREFLHINSSEENQRLFLSHFENSIDSLRHGDIQGYNSYAKAGGFSRIIIGGFEDSLPWLENDFTADELAVFEKLAAFQPK